MQCMNGISRIHKISKFATFHLCWSLCDLFVQVFHSVMRWVIVHRSSVRPRMTHEKGKHLANSLLPVFSDLLSPAAFQFQASSGMRWPTPGYKSSLLFLDPQFDRWHTADRQLSLVAHLPSCKTLLQNCWELIVSSRMQTFKTTTPLLFILPLVCCMGHAQPQDA